jgi:hypothetical protein
MATHPSFRNNGRKSANVRLRWLPSPGQRLQFARFQAERTRIDNLKMPNRIAKGLLPGAVHKPTPSERPREAARRVQLQCAQASLYAEAKAHRDDAQEPSGLGAYPLPKDHR